MIVIDTAFKTENLSVYEYFQKPGLGFYIPLYQREYSWDTDNIEQLLEDISKGIEHIVLNNSNKKESKIRFLGTIISVLETDKSKVQPQDEKGLPTAIDKVIDGQQRLSTICLFSALLYEHIEKLNDLIIKSIKKLSPELQDNLIGEINEIIKSWKDKLLDIFSLDLKRGNPKYKPKIIRGSIDKWVLIDTEDSSYKSDVSSILANYIEHFINKTPKKPINKETITGRNFNNINEWINKTVLEAHTNENTFCSGFEIIKNIDEVNIWDYKRETITDLLTDDNYIDKNSFNYQITSLIQVLAVCHYLLDRCCFTVIHPSNDDWAFDMFQSLNATGTPLTAIETFKPLIVNSSEKNGTYKGSLEEKYFNKIENLFGDKLISSKKSKLTNELLTSFALPVEGEKLESHFSSQRKWLETIYSKTLQSNEEQRSFLKFFGNYSEFYGDIWNNYKGENNAPIEVIKSSNDADIVSLLLIFLKDSNHKMAITVMGAFYNDIIEKKTESISNFCNAVKAISAFYILWRASSPNSGLDDIYRSFFKGVAKTNIRAHNWINDREFNITDLKEYLKNVLKNKKLDNKKIWVEKAVYECKYSSSIPIVKFALFNSAHDTICDPYQPGLMNKGTNNSYPFLKLENWTSKDYKTIEHIAPENPADNWSRSLYNNDKLYHSVGNLTLLPNSVNSSLGNKSWKEKIAYYKHLSESNPEKLNKLGSIAKSEGINLSENNLSILINANYSSHLLHLITYENQEWDSTIVNLRAERILELLWDKITIWLN